MKSFNYIITDELGIHARPAGLLVKEAKQFTSEINIEVGAKKASAKGLMGIMTLGAKCGTEIKVTATGDDEDAAISALEAFFNDNL